MAPHLDRWDERWRAQGLEVVQVENGQATSLAELEGYVSGQGITHPVLYDGGGELAQRYGVTGFPTAVLVSRNGRVLWHGYPTRNLPGLEAAIAKAIAAK
jgi:hypothetical protein